MCGIAGIVQGNGTEQAAMARMLHALRHRGPDGEWQYGADGAIFGHRRLSIIDLEGGRQPLLNADRSVWVVCNGEIYNYRELRKDFEQRGYPFQTHSDCEVIIALYERHGERLIEHLRGMFAFGLWDARRRKLIAARDHLGQKPLYYARTAAGFAFASEIKALLAFDPALRQMDLEALDQYLALRLIAPPRSMFAASTSCRRVTCSSLEDGGEPRDPRAIGTSRYQPKLEGSDESLTDELEEQVDEALRLHLVSDVPVGAFLSGGLDSSLLVAMLAAARRREEPARPSRWACHYQRSSTRRRTRARWPAPFGTEHHERTLDASLLKYLPQLIYHLDEPSDPLSLCTYQVAALARRHVKVVIGGDGGDELFGGYDRYYGNLYAGHYAAIPAAHPARRAAAAAVARSGVGLVQERGPSAALAAPALVPRGRRPLRGEPFVFLLRPRARAGSCSTPEASRQLAATLDAEAAIRDPYESAARRAARPHAVRGLHGAPARSPGDDHRPHVHGPRPRGAQPVHGPSPRRVRRAPCQPAQGAGPARCAYIQRALAQRYLPPQILDRPKQGFSSALPYILQSEYQTLYERPSAIRGWCRRASCERSRSRNSWRRSRPAAPTMATGCGC